MTTISHYTIPNHHTAPVCPPDQDATCICGDRLADHLSDGGPHAADIGDKCPHGPGSFILSGGDTLDCEHVTECTVCEVEVCTEHSTAFTSCADTGLHHLDCASHCVACRMAGPR